MEGAITLDEGRRRDAERLNGDSPAAKSRLAPIPFNHIQLGTTAVYLVKDLIPREGLVVVWGPPKCGKSFWTFDLVMHPALGWEYRGRKVKQGAVVYVACEGQQGFKARIEAFRQRHLSEEAAEVPFYLIPASLNLIAEHADLVAAIRAELGDTKPAAVVIDTLNRSLNGDENGEDMTAYIRAAAAVQAAFGCVVIVVHHCGVEGKRPRGHTSLTGACDAQIAIKRDDAGAITTTVEWMKDGPEGDEICSRLEVMEVGVDEDGEPIKSCVIIEAEPAKRTTATTLTKNQQTMLGLLDDLGPDGATIEDWNMAAREAGLGVTRKADLRDFRKALKDKQRVHTTNDRWYVTRL